MRSTLGKTFLPALAALALVGVAAPGQAAAPAPAADSAAAVAPAAYPSAKTIKVAKDDQDNGYFCGPAAVRNALSGRGIYTVQSDLAKEMGTDQNGTDSVANVTPVLNKHTKTSWYESKYIKGYTATAAEIALLKRDILLDTNKGFVIVANVVGNAVDTKGKSHGYSGGHYIDVVGYSSSGDTAAIYDPADGTSYSMTTARLATWIAERGYSA